MDKAKAERLAVQMLTEAYKKSEPSITWSEYQKRYSGTGIRGFENHFIEKEKAEAILEKYKKKAGQRWANSLGWIWLDFCPAYKGNEYHGWREYQKKKKRRRKK